MKEHRKGDPVEFLVGGWTPATPNFKILFCSKCQAQVYIAPSGQRILKENPNCKTICFQCAMDSNPEQDWKHPPIADIIADLSGNN